MKHYPAIAVFFVFLFLVFATGVWAQSDCPACKTGYTCLNKKCVPQGSTVCGPKICAPQEVCALKQCVPKEAVCGPMICPAGKVCLNKLCREKGSYMCGSYVCSPRQKCLKNGCYPPEGSRN